MGRATRWLKSLFGIKNKRDGTSSGHRRDKKGSSFGHSGRENSGLCHNPETIPPNLSPAEAAWIRSYYSETEKEQSKHAIAVAAATAAAADAAVAAAQAAVAVVRLTSHGRGTMFGGSHERWAAVKIQTVFRGYLVSCSCFILAEVSHFYSILTEINLTYLPTYLFRIVCFLLSLF